MNGRMTLFREAGMKTPQRYCKRKLNYINAEPGRACN